jgi:hypothetical protein
LDAIKRAVDTAAANSTHPDKGWDVDSTTLTEVEEAFEEARKLLKAGFNAYSVRIAQLR